MSKKFTNQTLGKPFLTMLSVINLPSTDMKALHSLLCFVAELCANINLPTRAATLDQPLYSKLMKLYQQRKYLSNLVSFINYLDSNGCLMEGSGLRRAPECVYALLTVDHMFSGKGFPRVVCGHILCASTILSLLLEDFLASLAESQYEKLIEIYESNKPDNHINDDVAINMIGWFKIKKEELSSQCRTTAFLV